MDRSALETNPAAELRRKPILLRPSAHAEELLDAAWLAVPGNFSDSREWTAKAYTQLGRSLLVAQDVDRLRTLADEIERWKAGQTHEKKLAAILHAGVKALEGDLDGVVEDFNSIAPSNLTDPAQLGLCLEVNELAERIGLASGAGGTQKLAHENVRKIREAIVFKLEKSGLRPRSLSTCAFITNELAPSPRRPGACSQWRFLNGYPVSPPVS